MAQNKTFEPYGNNAINNGNKTTATPSGEDPRNGCCFQGQRFFDAFKAMLTRCLFLLHALLCIWRVTSSFSSLFWLLCVGFVLLFLEAGIVLLKRTGKEWTWFQWSVLLYLLCCVPSIWILELDRMGRWKTAVNNSTTSLSVGYVSVALNPEGWTVALEQAILVIIILGRWLMPKGELTRDQLSALLLIYLGTASDIVDFLTLLAEPNVMSDAVYVYATLAVWTWSLMQFPFVSTAVLSEEAEWKREKRGRASCIRAVFETEAWAIIVSVLMQDGPFVIMRSIAIFKFSISTYSNYFFTFKNLLVLVLQVYRLTAIHHEHRRKQDKKMEELVRPSFKNLYKPLKKQDML